MRGLGLPWEVLAGVIVPSNKKMFFHDIHKTVPSDLSGNSDYVRGIKHGLENSTRKIDTHPRLESDVAEWEFQYGCLHGTMAAFAGPRSMESGRGVIQHFMSSALRAGQDLRDHPDPGLIDTAKTKLVN